MALGSRLHDRRRRWSLPPAAFLFGLLTVVPVRPAASAPPAWPDDRFHRVAADALLQELRAALLSEPSATLTLEHWCATHGIAADARIVAIQDPDAAAPLPTDGRALLEVGADETVRVRHVRLSCGGVVLSEADNWYVPSRLTPEMNRVLETTHTPFGKAVAALGFSRSTLSSRLLWSPLPPDWTRRPAGPDAGTLAIPETVLDNRGLLRDRGNRPLALVEERYKSGILAFPPPAP
ncbi:hypothetical protein NFI95_00420 [Acetobacteraceae bacterium KSS8]|uniref:Chorismate lyase n=1 Tax=Endosaccharibacter trunci TaxID=2812733 RepID=A0ABT1W219_9PROT|nr:hypothetical protein [Acetobacteraceae bacterium KSS8]